jgi:hypothetical protein
MRHLLFPSLVLCCTFLACKAKKDTPEPSGTMQCIEQRVYPIFRGYGHQRIDSFLLLTYHDNDNFNTLLKTQFISTGFIENNSPSMSYEGMHKGYDYKIIVPGTDTFLVTDFFNTPTQQAFTGRDASYEHCFYYEKGIVIDGDTLVPSGGESYSKLLLNKK